MRRWAHQYIRYQPVPDPPPSLKQRILKGCNALCMLCNMICSLDHSRFNIMVADLQWPWRWLPISQLDILWNIIYIYVCVCVYIYCEKNENLMINLFMLSCFCLSWDCISNKLSHFNKNLLYKWGNRHFQPEFYIRLMSRWRSECCSTCTMPTEL